MENTVTLTLQQFDEMRNEIIELRSIIENNHFSVNIKKYGGFEYSSFRNVHGEYEKRAGNITYSALYFYPKNDKLEERFKQDIQVYNDLQDKTAQLDKANIMIDKLNSEIKDLKEYIESQKNRTKKGFWW